MELFEAIYARRSVRKYLPEPVKREVLEKIVAAGIEAPSGCNEQLRQYLIVDDPQIIEKIRPMNRAMPGATAIIIILVEPKGTKYGEFWAQDASAAMQNMLLAAVGLCYAGCWVEGAIRSHEDELRRLLGVPEGLRVWSLMPVGKAAEQPARPAKLEFSQIVHYNRYGKKIVHRLHGLHR